MNYLFLDTASSRLIISLVKNDEIIFNINLKNDNNLSNKLMILIEENFKKNNFEPKDIDKIFVVNGPGSFTGIRCGVTVAKTLAFLLNIEITTISELEAMASGYDEEVCPIIDARRGYVFGAVYDKGKNIIPDRYIKYDDMKKIFKGKFLSYDYNDAYEPKVDIIKLINKHKEEKLNPHLVVPNYLKKTEAEENLDVKRNYWYKYYQYR